MANQRPSLALFSFDHDKTVAAEISSIRRPSHVTTSPGPADAQAAFDSEKAMTFGQAARLYKKAIFFSMAMSLAVVMEGYNLAVIGEFHGYDAFRKSFGTEIDSDGNPRISPVWQAGIQNGAQAGSIIGLCINGYISEWWGFKKTMYISISAAVLFNFPHFFAWDLSGFLAGSVLLGMPWGVFQALTVTYASDITPSALRPYLTSYINMCWVFGQLSAASVLRACYTLDSEWGWRIPVALQWVWVPFILAGVWFAPESPWWLVRKGQYIEARDSIVRCTTPQQDIIFNPDHVLEMIKHTNALEESMHSGTSYLDCFKCFERRRTLIACMVWLAQACCGAAMMGFSVRIYRAAGLSTGHALNLSIGQYCMGAVGTVVSWFLMSRIGRRTLYMYGLCILCVLLMVVGGLGVISHESTSAAWGLGSVLLVYTISYNFTVGPVCYAIVSEISSTRLKIKTVVLARIVYNLGSIFNNIVVPRMLSPSEWNWAGMTGFFYAGLTMFLILFMYFMLPETRNRSFGELDVLFENNVSAGQFHKIDVDQFAFQQEVKVDYASHMARSEEGVGVAV